MKEYQHRCSICGKYFMWHSPNCKYCSESCRAVGKKQKNKERHLKSYHPVTVHEFICIDCGKHYRVFGHTKRRKYCDSCLSKYSPSKLLSRKELKEEEMTDEMTDEMTVDYN